MFLFTYSAVILSLICVGIAALVLTKKKYDRLSLYFIGYILSVSGWIGSNALADWAQSDFTVRLWSGTSLISGCCFISFYLCFIEYFLTEKKLNLKKYFYFFLPTLLFSAIAFTDWYVVETILFLLPASTNYSGYHELSDFTFPIWRHVLWYRHTLAGLSHRETPKTTPNFLYRFGIFCLTFGSYNFYRYFAAIWRTSFFYPRPPIRAFYYFGGSICNIQTPPAGHSPCITARFNLYSIILRNNHYIHIRRLSPVANYGKWTILSFFFCAYYHHNRHNYTPLF